MTTHSTSPSVGPNPEEVGDEQRGDPQELLRKTESRAEEENRKLFRELRKHFLLGAAFQAGKKTLEAGGEALKDFIEDLTTN